MPQRLIRLSAAHFAILLAGVALVMFVIVSVAEPWLWDMYAREIGLPQMAKRHGFTYGAILVERDGPTAYGVVDIDRDAALARSGLRAHDAPVTNSSHGSGGAWALYNALRAVERGEAASFEVINVDDWTAYRRPWGRRIEIPARR